MAIAAPLWLFALMTDHWDAAAPHLSPPSLLNRSLQALNLLPTPLGPTLSSSLTFQRSPVLKRVSCSVSEPHGAMLEAAAIFGASALDCDCSKNGDHFWNRITWPRSKEACSAFFNISCGPLQSSHCFSNYSSHQCVT